MKIKTVMRYYFIPTRMSIIKKSVTSVIKDVDKMEPTYAADGNVNWCPTPNLESNLAIL